MNKKILSVDGQPLIYKNSFISLPLQDKSVTPGIEEQIIAPDADYIGLSGVTIEGDANLIPENIAKDVSIFGVEGTHVGGPDVSNVTVTESDVLAPKVFVDSEGIEKVGSIPTKSAENLTALGASVLVPAGYYPTDVSKNVATIEQVTPIITVSSGGLITASATQAAGYVSAGTKSGTKQLTVQAAQTITPSTSNKTIASGLYLTGIQTIKGDANLKAANIKKGVSIFGVTGSYEQQVFAFITVTYPAGSTLTCTDGVETLTAETTTGSYVFCVPYAATWTVKATDGSHTASKAISITTKWQSVNAALAYNFYIYKSGNQYSDVTGGWKDTSYSLTSLRGYTLYKTAWTHSGTTINLVATAGDDDDKYQIAGTQSAIDFTHFSKIRIVVTNYRASYSTGCFSRVGIVTSKGNAYTSSNVKAYINASGTGTLYLNVSNITGTGYVFAAAYASGAGGSQQILTISEIEVMV